MGPRPRWSAALPKFNLELTGRMGAPTVLVMGTSLGLLHLSISSFSVVSLAPNSF